MRCCSRADPRLPGDLDLRSATPVPPIIVSARRLQTNSTGWRASESTGCRPMTLAARRSGPRRGGSHPARATGGTRCAASHWRMAVCAPAGRMNACSTALGAAAPAGSGQWRPDPSWQTRSATTPSRVDRRVEYQKRNKNLPAAARSQSRTPPRCRASDATEQSLDPGMPEGRWCDARAADADRARADGGLAPPAC